MKLVYKNFKHVGIILGICLLFVFVVYVAFEIIPRIGGITKIPPNQIIREKDNICVLFVFNSGASEEAMVATAYCHELQKDLATYTSFEDVWEEEHILSWDVPMECPMVTLRYDKQYQSNVITFKQDPICNTFISKNPLKTEEIVEIRYIVDKKGQLVEIEKKRKNLKSSKNF